MPLPTPPLPGDQVGPYTLRETVGVGGMATVYLANSDRVGRVALKILHPGKAFSDEARRFKREFLALKRLRHPGIVRVFDSGEHGDYPWIAMEYVPGTDLGTLLETWQDNDPPDRFDRVEKILKGLADALSYVHGRNLIHRDLKPSNVLITEDGRPKLTDFGVVKAPGAFSTELTAQGRLVGTVAFMAPEQITGDPIDPRADLYSLGAVLYVLLTFQRPIQADSIAGYLARHLTETPRPPSEVEPRVPRKLERICLKLLRKDPGQRYTSARQLLEALEEDDAARKTHLLGREPDVERILHRIASVGEGSGGVFVVHGASGMGKSTLFQEVMERARMAGHKVARASGADKDPLGNICEQLPPVGPEEQTLPGSNASELGFDTVRELPAAVAAISTRARREPWTFIIDDIDQMSVANLDALAVLIRQKIRNDGLPYLIVTSAVELDAAGREIISGAATGLQPDVIPLAPLDRQGSVNLVRDLGLAGNAGVALGRRLHEELEGNPGLIREQVGALVRAGWLKPAPDGLLKPEVNVEELAQAQLPVPDRVLSREEGRLRRLPDEGRTVLDVLALLGMEATVDLVGEVSGLDPIDVGRGIEALVQARLVRKWVEGVEEVVGLTQPRYREMIYRLMDRNARTEYHRSAARALQRRTRRRVGPLTEVIASHLLRGGEVNEAYPMVLQAARWDLRNGDVEAAMTLLKQAKEVRTKAEPSLAPEEAVRNRRVLFAIEGELLERSGQLNAALSAWEQALSAAEEEKNRQAIARSLAGVGLVQALRGKADAIAPLERTIKRLPQGDPVWPRVAKALAECRLVKGDVEGSLKLWRDLEDLGRETGAPRIEADALVGLATVSLAHGRTKDAGEALGRAEQRLQTQNDPEGLCNTLSLMAMLALHDGRLRDARERAREADGAARDGGYVAGSIRARGIGTLSLIGMGEEAAARKLARDAATMAKARGEPRTVQDLIAVLPLARGLVDLGQDDVAMALLPKVPPAASLSLEDPPGQLLGLKSRIYGRRDPKRSMEMAMQAFDRPRAPMMSVAARIRLDAAHALAMGGQPRKALKVAQSVLSLLHGRTFRLLCLEAEALCARLGGDGRHGRNQARLRSELDRELGSPPGFVSHWT